MKKKTYKIIICISLVVMLLTGFGNVFGATNPEYTPTVNVSENALDTKIKDSILLDTLANMINAVASLAEYLIGAVFKALTGDNVFPWADRIIFNGIGFLDINFLNPADNSLFVTNGSDSILGQVVKQVYSSIFSLAVLFLGVAVGVMAIRLAISSIAAEKAKYKQAIVNWATCLVMLFLMHYILAFVFWINEQLVRVASGILIQTIEKNGLNSVDFTEALNSVISPEERVQKFCDTAASAENENSLGMDPAKIAFDISGIANITAPKRQYLISKAEITNNLLINNWYVDNRLVYVEDNSTNWWQDLMQNVGMTQAMVEVLGVPRLYVDVKDADSVKYFIENNDEQTISNQRKKGYYDGADGRKLFLNKEAYFNSDEFKKDVILTAASYAVKDEASKKLQIYYKFPEYKINTGDNPNWWQSGFNMFWSAITLPIVDDYNALKNQNELINNVNKIMNDNTLKNKIADQRLKVDAQIISAATGVKTSTTDIIANLGQFFKQSAYVYTTEEVTTGTGEKKEVITGWRASKLSVTGALLYAIFIFQSCMYFIMYVKRLFYVMMLSMFGPIVVIYDFFTKSAS